MTSSTPLSLRRALPSLLCVLLGLLALPAMAADNAVSRFNSDLTLERNACGLAPNVSFTPGGGLSQQNALMMLMASRLTQQEIRDPREQWTRWGFDRHELITDRFTTTHVQIASNGQFHVVAFRGTTSRFDYISNAIVGLQAYGPAGSGVHFGFWQGNNAVARRVDAALERMGRDKPVYFIGHSRGAAMTTLQALRWQQWGGQVAGIYAFAQPRLGNAAFNQWLQDSLGDRYYRYNVNNDITPHVPPLADVVPALRQRRILAGFLARTLETMRYAPAQGTALIIDASGQVTPEGDPLLNELDYWQGMVDTVRQGNPVTSLTGLFAAFPKNHDMNLHICAISRHIKDRQ
jgi:hypothetical protein